MIKTEKTFFFLGKLGLEVGEGGLEGGVGLRGNKGRGRGGRFVGAIHETIEQGLVFLPQFVYGLLPEVKPLLFWIVRKLEDTGVGGHMSTSGDFTLEIQELLFELIDAVKEGLILRVRRGERFVVVEQAVDGGVGVGFFCLIAGDQVFEKLDFALEEDSLGVLFLPGVFFVVELVGEIVDVRLCRGELGLELGMLILKGVERGKGRAMFVEKGGVLEAKGGKSLVVRHYGRRRRRRRRRSLELSELLTQRVRVSDLGLEGVNLFAQDLGGLVCGAERDKLCRQGRVVRFELTEMLCLSFEFSCDDVMFVWWWWLVWWWLLELVLEVVDVSKTVCGK